MVVVVAVVVVVVLLLLLLLLVRGVAMAAGSSLFECLLCRRPCAVLPYELSVAWLCMCAGGVGCVCVWREGGGKGEKGICVSNRLGDRSLHGIVFASFLFSVAFRAALLSCCFACCFIMYALLL